MLLGSRNSFGESLIDIHFRGKPDSIAREFPRDVHEPKCTDAEPANIVQTVASAKQAVGDEREKLVVADGEKVVIVWHMEGGYGEDCRSQKRG